MAKQEESAMILSSQSDLDLLKRMTQNERLTDDEFQIFIMTARARGLNPLLGELSVQKRGGRLTMVASIDSMRRRCQDHPDFAGFTDTEWFDGERWHAAWANKERPIAARVGVHRIGWKEPVFGIATSAEFFGSGPWWSKGGGAHMLAKCAEALALRRAFSSALSGIYTREEMEQADAPITARVEPEPKGPKAPKPVERMTAQELTEEFGSHEERLGLERFNALVPSRPKNLREARETIAKLRKAEKVAEVLKKFEEKGEAVLSAHTGDEVTQTKCEMMGCTEPAIEDSTMCADCAMAYEEGRTELG